ncbi:hypothetical protein GCM10022419_069810 [Nonomuraea rosea]|uniref:Uncharacterized protein n=1 Tax=Nonomuraea rosea TaxID=638574 RepID=A0ABP6YBG7_9ACTN
MAARYGKFAVPRGHRAVEQAERVIGLVGELEQYENTYRLCYDGPGPGAQVRQVDRDRTHTGGLQQRAGRHRNVLSAAAAG